MLTGRNGLMISAMGAGRKAAERNPRHLECGRIGRLGFILLNHMKGSARYCGSAGGGQVGEVPGFLEDHAYLLNGADAMWWMGRWPPRCRGRCPVNGKLEMADVMVK